MSLLIKNHALQNALILHVISQIMLVDLIQIVCKIVISVLLMEQLALPVKLIIISL